MKWVRARDLIESVDVAGRGENWILEVRFIHLRRSGENKVTTVSGNT